MNKINLPAKCPNCSLPKGHEGACKQITRAGSPEFRLLKAGEPLRKGDQVFMLKKFWAEIVPALIGGIINSDQTDRYPEGYYRRLV